MIGDTTEGFDDALGDALPTIAEVVAMPATQLGRPGFWRGRCLWVGGCGGCT